MSDNELDELLSQLKGACKKSRHTSSNETNLNTILKKIDVFINRRQMKLLNHQKRLDDLQRDLLLSECESSRNRVALEKKDFEVNQLHLMLDKAERTTQDIITKYDNEMQKLSIELCSVQQDYDRFKTVHKSNQEDRSMNEVLMEIKHLREFNKMLEIDNQRLYTENDQLKQTKPSVEHEKLLNSLQRSNSQPSTNQLLFESKIKSLEKDIEDYKQRSNQQSDEIVKFRVALNNSEQQCNSLRLELQRVEKEKEILKIHLIEQKFMESPTIDFKEIDYENFIRHELETNIDQANKLINYWNSYKQTLEDKIRQLTNEIHQLKKHNVNDLSIQISQCNENVLHAKREMNTLHMEVTDKNTIIYNLYRKIECLEQALMISKQRMNAQLNEIEELRSRYPITVSTTSKEKKQTSMLFDGISTDDECQIRQSIHLNKNLYTSSPIISANKHKHFHHFDSDSSSKL
ncbi:hypothetical protein I4U23_030452 [Adineta vaga]|nr:hypothetical protein I4U23_030452 [Adineta vaga]